MGSGRKRRRSLLEQRPGAQGTSRSIAKESSFPLLVPREAEWQAPGRRSTPLRWPPEPSLEANTRATARADTQTMTQAISESRRPKGSSSPSTSGLHHVAVQARELERSLAFYTDVLGLAETHRWHTNDGGLRSIWLDLGSGAFLALERADANAEAPSSQPFRDGHAGWHLVALKIASGDRASWVRRFEEAGVEIVHSTRWTLYVRDPDGNRIGLSHHPEEAEDPSLPPG